MSLVTLTDITGCSTFIGDAYAYPEVQQTATVWRIIRVQEATSGTTIAYADGVPTFTKAWSLRSAYNYTVS